MENIIFAFLGVFCALLFLSTLAIMIFLSWGVFLFGPAAIRDFKKALNKDRMRKKMKYIKGGKEDDSL